MLLHQIFLVIHIIAGALGMLLFWAPMMAKKGSPLHRKSGRWFSLNMHALAMSGIAMALLVLADPLGMKGHERALSMPVADFLLQIQLFWGFLLLLSLLALFNVRHGNAVLNAGVQRRGLVTVSHTSLWLVTQIWAVWILWQSFQHHFVLGQVFSVVALVTGFGAARYACKATVTAAERMQQHIGNMLGCGIAIYTAFFALGGRRLFELSAYGQLATWILPSVFGVIAIVWYNRQWQQKLTKTPR